jgi:predicted transcriptional regulator
MSVRIERPDLRVVVRILEALGRSGRPHRPTQLQQASGTNYSQFQRYLDLLVSRGLLVVHPPPDRFIELTPKGREAHRFLVYTLSVLLPGPGP